MPLNEVPILQPGTFDGGTVEEDTIGTLFRFVPLRPGGFNRFDAALARPLNPDDVTPEILDIGTISTITDRNCACRCAERAQQRPNFRTHKLNRCRH